MHELLERLGRGDVRLIEMCQQANQAWREFLTELNGADTGTLAARLGRSVRVTPACCSIALGDEVLALDDGSDAVQIDVREYLRRDAEQRRAPSSPSRRLGRIPVVSG